LKKIISRIIRIFNHLGWGGRRNNRVMSSHLYPKDFRRKVYIENVGEILNKHKYHYISFGLLGTGIEFLGKCINQTENPTWHENTRGLGKRNFDLVLTDLMTRYSAYKDSYKLCDSLRNGMAHAFQPKNKIELTHKVEADDRGWIDLTINSNDRLVIVAENFYDDFKTACLEVIRRIEANEFDPNGKMYKPFLEV